MWPMNGKRKSKPQSIRRASTCEEKEDELLRALSTCVLYLHTFLDSLRTFEKALRWQFVQQPVGQTTPTCFFTSLSFSFS
jgi:hypothetical protein